MKNHDAEQEAWTDKFVEQEAKISALTAALKRFYKPDLCETGWPECPHRQAREALEFCDD